MRQAGSGTAMRPLAWVNPSCQNCSISGQLLLCCGEAGNSLALSHNRRSSRQIGNLGRMTSLALIVEKLANFPGPVDIEANAKH